MSSEFRAVAGILRDAIAARAFPAASIDVGRAKGGLWTAGFGTLTYDPDAAPATPNTVFDLASLTKVLATTTLAMRAVDDGLVRLDARVSDWLPGWRGADREHVTLKDLLAHTSGLTSYLPFFRDYTGRAEIERAICTMPLEYAPGSRAVYSDLGFMLLGFVLDDIYGRGGRTRAADAPARGLATAFQQVAAPITAEPLDFNPPGAWHERTAPTEVDRWRGRLLVGEVHDENAWVLGGVAGHAGLFGTVRAVGAFARAVLGTIRGEALLARPETMRAFIARTAVPGSSRALGWDTMLPTSSCGTRLSRTSIGHTGFTGTSLWIDWEQDLYVVLLTNRVHPTRENDAIQQVRRAVHEAVALELPAA